jgi:DNA-binding SARP family transcriptional activator
MKSSPASTNSITRAYARRTEESQVQFEVLGPLQVFDDNMAEVRISRPRQRSLLAVLLLYANQPLSSGRLAEALCEGETGRSGSVLRTHILQLRRYPVLTDRVRTVPGGYLMVVEPGELDLDQFRGLTEKGRWAVRNGDHRVAIDLLTRAFQLWREPVLADIPRTLAMAQAANRLIDERRIAGEYLVTSRLAVGDHRELLGELRERVQANPLDERAWEQLMLALYRCGRQAEALDAFVQVRAILADEYGIDPGAGLRQLHLQILAGDPALNLGLSAILRATARPKLTRPRPSVASPVGARPQPGCRPGKSSVRMVC